jgi:hypothetical protein
LRRTAGWFIDSLTALKLSQDLTDLDERPDLNHDSLTEQKANLVYQHQLAGVCDYDCYSPVARNLGWEEVVSEHQFHRNAFKDHRRQLEIPQVNEFATILERQALRP